MPTSSTPVTAPLRLDEFFVEAFTIDAPVQAAQQAGGANAPELSVEVGTILRIPDNLRFFVPLAVVLQWPRITGVKNPPSMRLQLAGFFSCEAGTDEHHAHHLISLNAPAILYGIARGIIAQSLALTALQKFILPSVNFVEVMRQREEKQLASSTRRALRVGTRRTGRTRQPSDMLDSTVPASGSLPLSQ